MKKYLIILVFLLGWSLVVFIPYIFSTQDRSNERTLNVSELIAERDSLRELVKIYKCEFETIQDAVEFRSKCCDSVLIVRSIDQ